MYNTYQQPNGYAYPEAAPTATTYPATVLNSYPASVQQSLQQPGAPIGQALAALATASPEYCALICAGQMGYSQISRQRMGFRTVQQWVPPQGFLGLGGGGHWTTIQLPYFYIEVLQLQR